MKLHIFSVRDSATDQYGNPMFMLSEGQCIRSLSDEVNRDAADNQLFRHSDSFELFCLGSFDTDTGMFETGVPRSVVTAKALKIAKE